MEMIPFIEIITFVFGIIGIVVVAWKFITADFWKYTPLDDFSFVTTISYNPDHDIDVFLPDTESAKFHIVGKVEGYPKKGAIKMSEITFVKNITKDETYRNARRTVGGYWEEGDYVAEGTNFRLCNIRSGVEISDALLRKLLIEIEK